jgi:hypothetical protein
MQCGSSQRTAHAIEQCTTATRLTTALWYQLYGGRTDGRKDGRIAGQCQYIELFTDENVCGTSGWSVATRRRTEVGTV